MDRTETVRWLLKKCNINLEAKGGWYKEHKRTPFLIAAQYGHLDILKLLEKAGADVNATNEDGDNALQSAKYSGNQEMIRYLQNKGSFNLEYYASLIA